MLGLAVGGEAGEGVEFWEVEEVGRREFVAEFSGGDFGVVVADAELFSKIIPHIVSPAALPFWQEVAFFDEFLCRSFMVLGLPLVRVTIWLRVRVS